MIIIKCITVCGTADTTYLCEMLTAFENIRD
jgi:hypothetical protein